MGVWNFATVSAPPQGLYRSTSKQSKAIMNVAPETGMIINWAMEAIFCRMFPNIGINVSQTGQKQFTRSQSWRV